MIFECVGHRSTMDECVGWAGALGRRGRLVFIGYTGNKRTNERTICTHSALSFTPTLIHTHSHIHHHHMTLLSTLRSPSPFSILLLIPHSLFLFLLSLPPPSIPPSLPPSGE